jgi:hypothetical protein
LAISEDISAVWRAAPDEIAALAADQDERVQAERVI